jgi:hypothetical protein
VLERIFQDAELDTAEKLAEEGVGAGTLETLEAGERRAEQPDGGVVGAIGQPDQGSVRERNIEVGVGWV